MAYLLNTGHAVTTLLCVINFFFFLTLRFFYQYALNIEQFDVAKQLREKLTEVTSTFTYKFMGSEYTG